MADLSFSTFAEFINALDRANKVEPQLAALTARVESLKIEDADLTKKVAAAASDIDQAKKDAKALREKGEADRLETEKRGREAAQQIINAAKVTADQANDEANKRLANIRLDIKNAETELAEAKRAAAEQQKKLDAINNQIASLKKLVA